MRPINIKGERFGRLVAVEFVRKTAARKSCWSEVEALTTPEGEKKK